MTIDRLEALQQNPVQTRDQASGTKVPITAPEVALGTAAAAGVRRKERWWVAPLRRIFVTAPEESRRKRRPFRDMAYLEHSRVAREMQRL